MSLGRPTAAAACTGCPEPLADLAHNADRIDLIRAEDATAAGGYIFAVEHVFKGPLAAVMTFPLAGAIQVFSVGTRWVLVLAPGHGLDRANAFAVRADGSVAPGGPFDVPTTLAGWYAAFPPATDTAPSPGWPPVPWFAAALAAAVLVGWSFAVRRLKRLR